MFSFFQTIDLRQYFSRSALRVSICLSILSFSISLPTRAQSLTNLLQPPSTPSTASTTTDPLNRATPSSSVLAFLQAAQSGNYTTAAQYLQMSAAHRQTEGEQLAQQLKDVLDQSAFSGRVGIFTQPEGTPQEGVPLGRQRIGTMSAGDVEVDLDMVRVTDPTAGKIWLVAADTLAKIPELHDQVEARQVEHRLPSVLVKNEFGGMPYWQWLALIIALPFAAAIGWLVPALLGIPMRWWARRRGQMEVASWRSVSGPVWLLAATLVHEFFARYLRMPLLSRHYYFQLASIAAIIAIAWIIWNIVQWSLQRVRNRTLARGHVGTGSLMLLGERIIKAVIVIAAALAVFRSLGFDTTTALAGLGIGGIAIGFGAQQTIANLFGGVSVLGDEVMRVGDVCKFGDRTGTVEDIGLRSTRVRTDERTLLAIPNGTVAAINVENFSRRDKILFKTTLGMRPETKADHMRYVLAELRRLLYSHSKIETQSVRVRLIDIAGTQLNIEVVSYILTRDYNEYAAVKEDLLLRMMDIMEDAGTGLALPGQTLYLSRDSGVETEKADAAAKKIADLREGKKLPFPDHHKEDIASFKGSIQYPQPESAVNNDPNSPRK